MGNSFMTMPEIGCCGCLSPKLRKAGLLQQKYSPVNSHYKRQQVNPTVSPEVITASSHRRNRTKKGQSTE